MVGWLIVWGGRREGEGGGGELFACLVPGLPNAPTAGSFM